MRRSKRGTGTVLRELRRMERITGMALAAKSGLDSGTISRLESDRG